MGEVFLLSYICFRKGKIFKFLELFLELKELEELEELEELPGFRPPKLPLRSDVIELRIES